MLEIELSPAAVRAYKKNIERLMLSREEILREMADRFTIIARAEWPGLSAANREWQRKYKR